MKATTPEREAIYSFFLKNLGMNAEDIASTFETTASTLQRLSSKKLEYCYRVTKRIIQLEIQEENETICENNGDGVNYIHDVHA